MVKTQRKVVREQHGVPVLEQLGVQTGNLVIAICGSAASRMIPYVVRNKGGLHNRLTRRIRLLPFNLYETERFLRQQRVMLDRYQILQLFMVAGGIPHYLHDPVAGGAGLKRAGQVALS